MKYDIIAHYHHEKKQIIGLSQSEFQEEMKKLFKDKYTMVDALRYNEKGLNKKATFIKSKDPNWVMIK